MFFVCVAALLLASSAHAARPRRHLSQAIATSNAVAGPGETVVSRSGATSESGQLTVSKVDAVGAGPGTIVNCEQEARSGQIKSKECGGGAASTASGWFAAPACKRAPSAYKVTRGTDGKPWGYEDAEKLSCALRYACWPALLPLWQQFCSAALYASAIAAAAFVAFMFHFAGEDQVVSEAAMHCQPSSAQGEPVQEPPSCTSAVATVWAHPWTVTPV